MLVELLLYCQTYPIAADGSEQADHNKTYSSHMCKLFRVVLLILLLRAENVISSLHYQLGCYLRPMKRSCIEASLVNANYRTRPESSGTCDSAVSWKF